MDGALPFGYESTGAETRFTCGLDPVPASRRVFTFHRPGTAELDRRVVVPDQIRKVARTLRDSLPESRSLRAVGAAAAERLGRCGGRW